MWTSQSQLSSLYGSSSNPLSDSSSNPSETSPIAPENPSETSSIPNSPLLDNVAEHLPPLQELLRTKPEIDSHVYLATDGFVYKLYNLLSRDAAVAFANESRVYGDDTLSDLVLPDVSVTTVDHVGIIKLPYAESRSLTHMTPQGNALVKNTEQGSPDALLAKTIPSPYVEKAKQLIKEFHKLGYCHNDIHGGNLVIFKDSLRLIDFESATQLPTIR